MRESNKKIERFSGTISNRFKLVSPKYNLTSLTYDFTYKEMIIGNLSLVIQKEEWAVALIDPRVVHFTTSCLPVRPWLEGCEHPYATRWKEMHDEAPWKNNPYRTMKNRKSRDRKNLCQNTKENADLCGGYYIHLLSQLFINYFVKKIIKSLQYLNVLVHG